MYSSHPSSGQEPPHPRLIMIPDQDGAGEIDSRAPFGSSLPGSKAQPIDQFSEGITSPRPLFASSEPEFDSLRFFTQSPVSNLTSNLANMNPLASSSSSVSARSISLDSHCNSVTNDDARNTAMIGVSQCPSTRTPPPVFSLPLPSSSPTLVGSTRVSPRFSSNSPGIFHSSPCRSLLSLLTTSAEGVPSNSSPSGLSRSMSSTEEFLSATDSSDGFGHYSMDRQSQFSDDGHIFSPPDITDQLTFASPSSSKTMPNLSRQQPNNSFFHSSSPTLILPSRANSEGPTNYRLRSRTLHSDRPSKNGWNSEPPELLTSYDISSPTRSRGGTSSPSSSRSASFLNNHRPSHSRTRKDSITSSGSRPRPRPFVADSNSDIVIPKEAPVDGLIPNLRGISSGNITCVTTSTPSVGSNESPVNRTSGTDAGRNANAVPPSPSRGITQLPFFYKKGDSTVNHITPATLLQLLKGEFSHIIPEFYIIDCRSEVEFIGGHIRGAINYPDPQMAISRFIHDRIDVLRSPSPPTPIALIFHCEWSEQRGPTAMKAFRGVDRELNMNSWPKLFYPDVYCLEGGYRRIFFNHQDICEPLGYVPEPDAEHKNATYKKACSMSRTGFSHSLESLPSTYDEAEEVDDRDESPSCRMRPSASEILLSHH